MLSLTHTLISLPFGIYFNNPILIFIAAFVFHIFTDTLLHWNIYPRDFPRFPVVRVSLDVIGGLVIAWFLLGNELFTLSILAAIAGGNAPDVMHSLWELSGKKVETEPFTWKSAFFHIHDKLQVETRSVAKGLIWQGILITISIILIR